jgi:hypothetical protein
MPGFGMDIPLVRDIIPWFGVFTKPFLPLLPALTAGEASRPLTPVERSQRRQVSGALASDRTQERPMNVRKFSLALLGPIISMWILGIAWAWVREGFRAPKV